MQAKSVFSKGILFTTGKHSKLKLGKSERKKSEGGVSGSFGDRKHSFNKTGGGIKVH